MGRLVIFDTSNFTDFPIGGQLTSVRGFLRFLAEKHPDRAEKTVLAGVTTREQETGTMGEVELFGIRFPILYAARAETDLSHTQHSLRAAYAEGILKYGRALHLSKKDLCYIQTPEAAGPARLLCPGIPYVIFSHGSYANMERGFRFYQKSFIKKAFLRYLRWLLRHAALIFVLDENSRRDYLPFNQNLVKARNSIVLPPEYDSFGQKEHTFRGRLLFVGRLSKDKGLAGILEAEKRMEQDGITLTVVGDGEEGETFRKEADAAIRFTGAVPPGEVGKYMEEADILVMNSDFEGVPMTILEALSHGLPVISTDVGGIADTVDFGKDAEKTDGTPEGIIQAVETIRKDYRSYAEAAHAHAKTYDYREANETVYQHLCRFWRLS